MQIKKGGEYFEIQKKKNIYNERIPRKERERCIKKIKFSSGGVLSNILKSFTLDENDDSLQEPLTKNEKDQIKYRLKKINDSLENKERHNYKPFFSIFDASKEEVLMLVKHTLTEDEIKILQKKYGVDFSNTEYIPNLTETLTVKINSIIVKLKRNLKKYKSGEYVLIGIEDLYNGTSLIDLKKAVFKLPNSYRRAFYSNFGKSLELKKLVRLDQRDSFIDEESLESLNKRLNGESGYNKGYIPFIELIEDVRKENETDEELLNRARKSFVCLNDEELQDLYKKYGKDLKNTKNVPDLSREKNQIILNIYISRIKRHMERMAEVNIKYCKTLIERFDELTTLGDVLLEIAYLDKDEQNLLKSKFGEDYLKATPKGEHSSEFNKKLRKIIEKLKKRINRKRRKEAKLELATLKKILELTKTQEYTNLKNVIGINPALAVLAKKHFDDVCSTSTISELTGVDIVYIIDVTKAYLALELSYNRALNQEDVNILKRKIGE